MSGCRADNPSVYRAMSRSEQATCGKSEHTSPTAITIATKITARVRSWFSKAGQEHHEPVLPSVRRQEPEGILVDICGMIKPIQPSETSLRGRWKGTFAMRAYNTNRDTSDRMASA